MAKQNKKGISINSNSSNKENLGKLTKSNTHKSEKFTKHSDYLFSMSMAPRIGEGLHWFQMLPATFFTAFVIMIVRLHQYERPMSQFYWTNIDNKLTDFFSYYKMVAIVICAVLALVFILYRIFSQSLSIKRSAYYIPMLVYSAFVLISYFMSDYKQFAFLGWNDRFEGTISLLAYMIILFYVINTINNEANIKWIIYPTAISSFLLSLLGLSQALDHDFFRTNLGKMLITPSWFWDSLDGLTFTFQNKEIYQTVYNINYVSFYLTLLIPLFGLLFIHSVMLEKSEPIWKKILWGVLFALTMFNLIGSESSGGFLGMAVVIAIAIIVLNKTIITWWKPLSVLIIITILVAGVTYNRWLPELTGAANGVLGAQITNTQESTEKGYIDYIETKGNDIIVSYEGNQITFTTFPENPLAIKLTDAEGKDIDINPIEAPSPAFSIKDDRFSSFIIGPAKDSAGINYFIIKIDVQEWPFAIVPGTDVRYRNDLGNLVSLNKIDSIGWFDNQSFGSGRGYIWSRTLPIMKDTRIIGHGADTYCLYFPNNDYVGKYNANWNINMIVDKPHNMYMGAWIGTGGISVFALLVLWLMYIIQSIKLFWNRKFNDFIEFSGLGIFLGICGFLVSGLVDDSTVSVMPMFYGLLGTGIAINMILNKKTIK